MLGVVVVGVPLELLGEGGAGQGRSWIGILGETGTEWVKRVGERGGLTKGTILAEES